MEADDKTGIEKTMKKEMKWR